MKKSILLMVFLIIASCICATSEGAIPHLINYQGKVVNEDNMPLNGSYAITFRIYNAQSAGTLLWEETHSGAVVQDGLFSVLLGSVTSLGLAFDVPYYLEIKVGGEVMSPRQLITASGYALRAEVAENAIGIDPSLVGTKTVDESAIGDGKALTYSTSKGKLEYKSLDLHQAKSGFCFGLHGGEIQGIPTSSWVTFYSSKPFTKSPGLNTITCVFHGKRDAGEGAKDIRLKISNLTGQKVTVSSTDLKIFEISIDVSSLIDGTVYVVEMQCSGAYGTGTFQDIIFEHS